MSAHARIPPTNRTAYAATMMGELDLIDDAFCDIYSNFPGDRGHPALGRAIDQLQAWRIRYGMTS